MYVIYVPTYNIVYINLLKKKFKKSHTHMLHVGMSSIQICHAKRYNILNIIVVHANINFDVLFLLSNQQRNTCDLINI